MTTDPIKLLATSLLLLSLSACDKPTAIKAQPPLTQPEAPAPQGAGLKLTQATIAQLCDEATKTWRCTSQAQPAQDLSPDAEGDEDAPDDPLGECSCTLTKTLHTSTSKGPFKSAAILSVEGSDGFVGGSIDGAEHLVVETVTGGWQHVSLLTNNYSPGAGGFYNNGTLENITFQTINDQELLLVHFTNEGSENNISDRTTDESTAQRLLLCAMTGNGAQCIKLGIGGEQRTRSLHDDEGSAQPPSKQWRATATITPQGKLKYTLPDGQPHAPEFARALHGERSLDEITAIAVAQALDLKPLR